MQDIQRPYTPADVRKLQGNYRIEHTVARLGAKKLRDLIETEPFVRALGALTGNQAVQMVKAGLKAIYLSGWQVAADANTSGQTYPDQSLYPVNSVPEVVRRINRALVRADQIEYSESAYSGREWLIPIVADAEAGFGGPLNVYELVKALIEAGAAAVHLEDQLSSEKKCGHLGGKVLIPTSQHIRSLVAARLAADVMDVPTVIIARTDADSAKLITSDHDPIDRPFLTRGIEGHHPYERTPEGFFHITGGMQMCVARGLAYAPYADMLWMETSTPNLDEAREFAERIHAKFPGKPLAYNCSPSFNWRKKLSDVEIAAFQDRLGQMGYKFQFVTLAGFHALNYSMYELASDYSRNGMSAYSRLQEEEFSAERTGYTATKHQREVGVGYFDQVSQTISSGLSSTTALEDSTEKSQF